MFGHSFVFPLPSCAASQTGDQVDRAHLAALEEPIALSQSDCFFYHVDLDGCFFFDVQHFV